MTFAFDVEAQDMVNNGAYTDGYRVFTVRRTRAVGSSRMVVVTKTGRVFLANNDQGFRKVK
jgi:hypothetical protein